MNNEINNQPTLTPSTPQKEKTSKREPFKKLAKFLFITSLFLIIGLIATYKYMNQQLIKEKYNCVPITGNKEEKELDIHSTLIQSLYNKVVTNIYEDLAQPTLNDQMKLYLAYRQILEKDKYNANTCNKFSPTSMEPYTCTITKSFLPKAFKEEIINQKLKELYGENINIPLQNIQLGRTCVVGYQYIASRGEFVEGYCDQKATTSFSVEKELTKAISIRNNIILSEKVKYYSQGGKDIPDKLKSGIYHYIFRLDMNYNYVLIDKSYEENY